MNIEIIPALDLRNSRCVRLRRGRFDAVSDYGDDALGRARAYAAAGARRLHVVDLDGAEGKGRNNVALVAELAANAGLEVQAGGGLRSAPALDALFNAGAGRAVIGSLAVTDRDTVSGWLRRFGSERIVLALDVRCNDGTPWLLTHGWQRSSSVSLWDALASYVPAGLRHVLCTDVELDGMAAGPNVDLYRNCLQRFSDLALQASGGIRDRGDLAALAEAGVPAAISGKALLDGTLELRDAG